MAIKNKIIVFIVMVIICFLAQSYDAYTGVNNPEKDAHNIDPLID